ncbi:MAG: hypothetical protein AAFP92_25070, partial [Bacteroidota bacterium]
MRKPSLSPSLWVFLFTAGVGMMLWLFGNQKGSLESLYPLDDSYIHLAMAQHLVSEGVWAPAGEHFQGASSSPLYTLLLSLLVGWLGQASGLILNLLFLGGIFFLLNRHFSAEGFQQRQQYPILLALLITTPLYLLPLWGMEHVGHILACLWLFLEAGKCLAKSPEGWPWSLWLSAMVAVGFRYESLFLIAGLGLVMLWKADKKRLLQALGLGLFAGLPVLAYGFISLWQGNAFLPNSLIAKSYLPELSLASLSFVLRQALDKILDQPFVLSIAFFLCSAWWINRKKPQAVMLKLSLAGLIGFLFHLLLAQFGGVRYEAYLVFLSVYLLGMTWTKTEEKSWGLGGLVMLAMIPLILRAGFFTYHYPTFRKNIYEQPYQVARFLRTHYAGESVAINDLGWAAYLHRGPLTDFIGLGDHAVIRERARGASMPAFFDQIAQSRDLQVAALHPGWKGSDIPSSWIKVGVWTIQENMICAQ